MKNKKHTAKQEEHGVYQYRGWRITSRRITSDRAGWNATHITNEDWWFDGHFIRVKDAKDWIDEWEDEII